MGMLSILISAACRICGFPKKFSIDKLYWFCASNTFDVCQKKSWQMSQQSLRMNQSWIQLVD